MKNSIITLVLLFTLSSCTHYYYAPTVKNVPLFKEKNEIRATVSAGGGDETRSFGLQAAYSITDNIAAASNLMIASGGNYQEAQSGRGTNFDFAVGYYKPIASNFVFEVFGGIGTCQQNHLYSEFMPSYFDRSKLTYSSIFIQPSFGLSIKGFDVAFTPSFTRMNFRKIEYFFSDPNPDNTNLNALILLDKNRASYLFEPGITLRGGWDHLKVQTQLVTSFNLTKSSLPFDFYNLSLGLQFAFAERFKKGKK